MEYRDHERKGCFQALKRTKSIVLCKLLIKIYLFVEVSDVYCPKIFLLNSHINYIILILLHDLKVHYIAIVRLIYRTLGMVGTYRI